LTSADKATGSLNRRPAAVGVAAEDVAAAGAAKAAKAADTTAIQLGAEAAWERRLQKERSVGAALLAGGVFRKQNKKSRKAPKSPLG
jgi:hypothetical protein